MISAWSVLTSGRRSQTGNRKENYHEVTYARFLTTIAKSSPVAALKGTIEQQHSSLFPYSLPLKVEFLLDKDDFLLPDEVVIGEILRENDRVNAIPFGAAPVSANVTETPKAYSGFGLERILIQSKAWQTHAVSAIHYAVKSSDTSSEDRKLILSDDGLFSLCNFLSSQQEYCSCKAAEILFRLAEDEQTHDTLIRFYWNSIQEKKRSSRDHTTIQQHQKQQKKQYSDYVQARAMGTTLLDVATRVALQSHDAEVKRKLAFFFERLCTLDPTKRIKFIVEHGVVSALVKLASSSDPKTQIAASKALQIAQEYQKKRKGGDNTSSSTSVSIQHQGSHSNTLLFGNKDDIDSKYDEPRQVGVTKKDCGNILQTLLTLATSDRMEASDVMAEILEQRVQSKDFLDEFIALATEQTKVAMSRERRRIAKKRDSRYFAEQQIDMDDSRGQRRRLNDPAAYQRWDVIPPVSAFLSLLLAACGKVSTTKTRHAVAKFVGAIAQMDRGKNLLVKGAGGLVLIISLAELDDTFARSEACRVLNNLCITIESPATRASLQLNTTRDVRNLASSGLALMNNNLHVDAQYHGAGLLSATSIIDEENIMCSGHWGSKLLTDTVRLLNEHYTDVIDNAITAMSGPTSGLDSETTLSLDVQGRRNAFFLVHYLVRTLASLSIKQVNKKKILQQGILSLLTKLLETLAGHSSPNKHLNLAIVKIQRACTKILANLASSESRTRAYVLTAIEEDIPSLRMMKDEIVNMYIKMLYST
eukprot:g2425.t1